MRTPATVLKARNIKLGVLLSTSEKRPRSTVNNKLSYHFMMHESIEGINLYQIEYPNELPEHFPHAKRIHLP